MLQDSSHPIPDPVASLLIAVLLTMIVREGEVAVLRIQGEFELDIPWSYVLVCCRDLHDQLEYGRWGMVSVVLEWPGVQGWCVWV